MVDTIKKLIIKHPVLSFIIFLVFVSFIIASSEEQVQSQQIQQPQPQVNSKKEIAEIIEEKVEVKTEESNQISDFAIQIATEAMLEYSGVKDAAVSQEDKQVSLALIVDYTISEKRARELGDNFVRLIKNLSNDESPGKEVGSGIYDYLIGVYDSNEKTIAIGGKVDFAKQITW